MAVGGLPSKRQGRLGRPKGHHHPHAMAFFVFSASSHSSSSPSSFFTFFFFFIPLSSLAYSFSFSSLACSLSFSSLARSLAFSFSSSAYSISCSFSFPTPLSLFWLQHLVRLHTVSGFSEPPHGTRLDTRLPVQGLTTLAFPPWPRHRPHLVFFKTNPERLGPQ